VVQAAKNGLSDAAGGMSGRVGWVIRGSYQMRG
jgi:hypothetical protein